MLTRMPLDTGGRFSLRLCDHDPSHARYELQLVTREGEWATGVQVSGADGQIEYAVWRGEGEPPGWLLHYSRAALRRIAVSGSQRASTRRVLSSGLSPNNSRYCEPNRPACQKPLASATDFTVLRLSGARN